MPEANSKIHFLGWDEPLLSRVATWMCKHLASEVTEPGYLFSDRRLDLSGWICALPTANSQIQFSTVLRQTAESESLQYAPPEILSIGQLPECLYTPQHPLAIEIEQTLAWSKVLSNTPTAELAPLVTRLPDSDEIESWVELASTIRRLHSELASDCLAFADVAKQAESEGDKRRWNLLAKLFDSYLASLNEAGLSDPSNQRQIAIDQQRCRSDHHIALIGSVDLSKMQAEMLEVMRGSVEIFTAAPESYRKHFSAIGCIDSQRWLEHELPILDEQLVAAGDIADQAQAAVESMKTIIGYSVDSKDSEIEASKFVTIGVTDESQVAPIEFELGGYGYKTARHLGWSVSSTAVGRAISMVATYLKNQTWQSLAALVRHPDVLSWVSHQLKLEDPDEILISLDGLLANHFPIQLSTKLTPAVEDKYPIAIKTAKCVAKWTKCFDDSERSLGQWCKQITKWFGDLYPLNLEESPQATRSHLAAQSTHRLLKRFSNVQSELDLMLSGADAMAMIASRIADLRVVLPAKPDEIEIVGWLDLALDETPSLIVVGLNHPFVPEAITNDPFLPGSFRTQLRMVDNDRRLARDIYYMQLLLSTRKNIRFIVGRNSADGSPTPPSRLLASAQQADVARRIASLMEGKRTKVDVVHNWDLAAQASEINEVPIPDLPIPGGDCPVKAMSVTAFRDYLSCPYRFFLRHVLKLKPIDDEATELAANQFGDLVHAAVEAFGKSNDRDEAMQEKIESLLHGFLHEYGAKHYGDASSTAVRIQMRQAERRLSILSHEQAKRFAEGWRIHDTEAPVSYETTGACIEVDGFTMGLRGRLDRIDFHPATGRYAILDYKTHGHKPEKKHLKNTANGQQWIDLQLPLYRMMIPYLGINVAPVEVELGYFNLSDKPAETRVNIASFSEFQMQAADELIYDCVRRIRDCDFAPSETPPQYDDYAMILQTGVLRSPLTKESDDE